MSVHISARISIF